MESFQVHVHELTHSGHYFCSAECSRTLSTRVASHNSRIAGERDSLAEEVTYPQLAAEALSIRCALALSTTTYHQLMSFSEDRWGRSEALPLET